MFHGMFISLNIKMSIEYYEERNTFCMRVLKSLYFVIDIECLLIFSIYWLFLSDTICKHIFIMVRNH